MRDVVICEPLRTPVGRYGGVLRDVPAADLATTVVKEIVKRSALSPNEIDDIGFGQCYPSGESPAIGRVVGLDAGLGVDVPGFQVDRRCGSALQAVLNASMAIQTEVADLIIAGGAESMSGVEFYSTGMRWGVRGDSVTFVDRLARRRATAGGVGHPIAGGMIETAENLRREYGISRLEQDEFAVNSHVKAVKAQADGRFDEEIVPVTVVTRSAETIVTTDEHPRADTTVEQLSALRAVMSRVDPEATVTAGNASGQNDGAAACIVTHRDKAEALGLRPVARLVSWAVAGVPPETMGIGPVPATKKALERAGLELSDIDLIELNEAFAAQVLAVTREWKFTPADFDRMNVNGSGISLGHPVGATGARILVTLVHEMQRRQARYGLETMCIGGGQGLAAIFEYVAN